AALKGSGVSVMAASPVVGTSNVRFFRVIVFCLCDRPWSLHRSAPRSTEKSRTHELHRGHPWPVMVGAIVPGRCIAQRPDQLKGFGFADLPRPSMSCFV